MAEIRIISFAVATNAQDADNGILGRFTAVAGPVRIAGCALIDEGGRGGVSMPRCSARTASIRLIDGEVRTRLEEAATAAFLALGGKFPPR